MDQFTQYLIEHLHEEVVSLTRELTQSRSEVVSLTREITQSHSEAEQQAEEYIKKKKKVERKFREFVLNLYLRSKGVETVSELREDLPDFSHQQDEISHFVRKAARRAEEDEEKFLDECCYVIGSEEYETIAEQQEKILNYVKESSVNINSWILKVKALSEENLELKHEIKEAKSESNDVILSEYKERVLALEEELKELRGYSNHSVMRIEAQKRRNFLEMLLKDWSPSFIYEGKSDDLLEDEIKRCVPKFK